MITTEILASEISPEKLKLINDEFEELFNNWEHMERIRKLQEDATFRVITGLPAPR